MAPNARVVWPRIFLFGDSLTQQCFSTEGGWGSAVAAAFERKCDVVARGFSGYNSRMCKHVLPRVLGPEDASTVAAFVLCLGANDSSSLVEGGNPVVPLDEFVQNMEEMLSHVRMCGIPYDKVILITPPPADQKAWAVHCKEVGQPLRYRSLDCTAKYAEACKELGSLRHHAVVDAFSAFLKEQKWENLLVDGLHFSRAGVGKLTELLIPHLEKAAGQLPCLFPNWRDVDPNRPELSLRAWAPGD
ncbi:isoamyl acetate-hydrolyzing esterase 1 homolog [Ixodes scapularis]